MSSISWPDIVKQVSPAVVKLDFMNAVGTVVVSGTGFTVRPDGMLATCWHVFEGARGRDATKARVRQDNRDVQVSMSPVAKDVKHDMVVLRLEKPLQTWLPYVRLGEPQDVRLAESVVVLGHPLGFPDVHTVPGTVSTLPSTVFRVDANIAEGSSGSPVFNQRGEVIGIVQGGLIAQDRRSPIAGFNFAISVGVLRGLLAPLPWGKWDNALLLYDRQEGRVETCQVNPDGSMYPFRRYDNLCRTWSHVVTGGFGKKGQPGVVFYSASEGRGKFYALDTLGGWRHLASHTRWRKTWRHLVPGQFTNTKCTGILFYDPTAGHGEFYSTAGDGIMSKLKRNEGWHRNWTHIIPGHFADSPYSSLLFYDATTGRGRFYPTDGRGGLVPRNSYFSWGEGWTHIIPGRFADNQFTAILFYNQRTRRAEFCSTDGRGNISLLKSYGNWRKTWKHIVAGPCLKNGLSMLLLYDADRGECACYSTHGEDGIRRLKIHTGWSRSLASIAYACFG